MPKEKAVTSLSGLIDTDMEDDSLNAGAFPTPDSNQENAGPSKKKGGRPKATAKRFTKAKRVSVGSVAPKLGAGPKKTAGRKRAPLKEQSSNQHAEDTEEVDDFAEKPEGVNVTDELVAPKPAKRKAPEKKTGRGAKKEPVKQPSVVAKDGEFEYTPTTVRQTKGSKKPVAQKGNASERQPSAEPRHYGKVIQETQVPMDVDHFVLPEEEEEDEELPQSVFRRSNNARINSRQRQPTVARRQGGSASDTERANGDPATRRKLGETTKKFESLELKYQNLRETGIKQAEANMEKLRAQSESKAQGSYC